MLSESRAVLVTGGSGFIGLHVVNEFLKEGYVVNTTTRSVSSEAAKPLKELQNQYPGKLNLFEADLLAKDAYKESMKDVEAVVHVATPVLTKLDDPYEDQIRPAVEGTKNVLDTCLETPSVKTIVVTSSGATVFNRLSNKDYVYSEKDFHKPDSNVDYPYVVAKVEAEKHVCKFSEQHKDRFRVVIINPVYVFGPDFLPDGSMTSIKQSRSNICRDMLLSYLCGVSKVIPQGGLPTVDVRDVATAHVRAVQQTKATGRIIAYENFTRWSTILSEIKSLAPNSNPPTETEADPSPEWADCIVDNSKSKEILGLSYIPIQTSIKDMISQIKEFN